MNESEFDRIAEEVSPEAVERLVRAFGGVSVYLPRDPKPTHKVCRVLGHDLVVRIVGVIGSGRLSVPTGARAESDRNGVRITALLRAGKPRSEIARTVGCTERTVSRWAHRLRKGSRHSHGA